jgi:hypothetical protein
MYNTDNNYIFTHPPKCGGTTIEEMVGFTYDVAKDLSLHRFKHASLSDHISFLEEKNYCMDRFFKFSIIRNPWLRMISIYNHFKYKGESSRRSVKLAETLSFAEFVVATGEKYFNSEISTKQFMLHNNTFGLDYVIRLENLKKDIINLETQLNINLNKEIPHRNKFDKTFSNKKYTEYYDKKTKDIVGELFYWDIKTFNYTFDI